MERSGEMARWEDRFLGDSRGFTLVEVVVVVAIILTLGVAVMPIVQDKIISARRVGAKGDIKALATAIATHYNDTTEFPTRKGAERDKIEVLRSSGNSTLDPNFATGITSLWGLTEVDDVSNHLLKDNPGGTPNGYSDANLNWRGPYIAEIGQDPWGKNYLVIAKGFYDNGTEASRIYAWILSGGPNETIETDISSNKLNSNPATGLSGASDDVGMLLFSTE
ncbi:MAG: prepilin-type N-terminal cleavage/methylation domain-containing protein [Planctomycetes bacterium]|nr:prepilin-type N-terminal cleavage/methylation domain-containing protein [Planctomycetota bacterium]